MKSQSLWKASISVSVAVLAIYFYLFMEWLFFATKPSFMSVLDIGEKLSLLTSASLPLLLVFTLPVFLSGVIGLVTKRGTSRQLLSVARVFPALILASSFLLLFDNFTLTVLGFGVRSVQGLWRLAYGALLLLFGAVAYRLVQQTEQGTVGMRFFPRLPLFLVGLSLFGAGVQFTASENDFPRNQPTGRSEKRPNILLISSDGLNAENMSVYGYSRDTTSFLRQFAAEALLCENAFPNAGSTPASIASMLTGKLPTRTRLIYPPDILRGADAYQHLPALLRKHGYRSIDLSVRHYADSFDLNLRNSFDSANFRTLHERQLPDTLGRFLGREATYFLERLIDRLKDRILHILALRDIQDAYRQVTEAQLNDPQSFLQVQELLRFIDESPQPFFAHLHLLGTHGPRFRPKQRHFSLGKEQTGDWMRDFYDDSILEFDNLAEQVISYLRAHRQIENTIVVFSSDHGQRWVTHVRTPLILRFPHGEHSGKMRENVQTVDVAPTLLDYLGIPQPSWMTGHSLLGAKPDPGRAIFGALRDIRESLEGKPEWETDPAGGNPPFHSLGAMSLILCNHWYRLDLLADTLIGSRVRGHTSPCHQSHVVEGEKARDLIIDHLSRSGYDTSSLSRSSGRTSHTALKENSSPVFPVSLEEIHPFFQNSTLGVSLVNPTGKEQRIGLIGRDHSGKRYLSGEWASVPALAQKTFMTSQVTDNRAEEIFLRVLTTGNPLYSLFMIGDPSRRRLDQIGVARRPLASSFLPVGHESRTQVVLIHISNPSGEESAQVSLRLVTADGRILGQHRLEIPSLGTKMFTMSQIFADRLYTQSGYLQVTSSIPVRAFELIATEKAFYSISAQAAEEADRLWLTYLVDDPGTSTEARLINPLKKSLKIAVEFFDHQGNSMRGTRHLLSAGQMMVLNLAEDGKAKGATKTRDAAYALFRLSHEGRGGEGVASAVILRKGDGTTLFPLLREGQRETTFPHLIHSIERGIVTRLALVNPTSLPVLATIQAFDQEGQRTGVRQLRMGPRAAVSDLLSPPHFFGSRFSQINGYIQLSFDQPVLASAFLESDHTLSVISGHAPDGH